MVGRLIGAPATPCSSCLGDALGSTPPSGQSPPLPCESSIYLALFARAIWHPFGQAYAGRQVTAASAQVVGLGSQRLVRDGAKQREEKVPMSERTDTSGR